MLFRSDEINAKELLYTLVQNGIGILNDDVVDFDIPNDRLQTALFAINLGADLEDVSEYLNWKDFESLTGFILEEKDFEVTKNLILTKPRMEIDVVGIRLGIAILIDCKHWNKYSISSLNLAVSKQIERTKMYVEKTPGSIGVPVIVTLSQDKINFIENVPIVPITKFSSFIDEFYGHLDEMETIEKN